MNPMGFTVNPMGFDNESFCYQVVYIMFFSFMQMLLDKGDQIKKKPKLVFEKGINLFIFYFYYFIVLCFCDEYRMPL